MPGLEDLSDLANCAIMEKQECMLNRDPNSETDVSRVVFFPHRRVEILKK